MKKIILCLLAILLFVGCSAKNSDITLSLSFGERVGKYEGETNSEGIPNGIGKFTTTNENGDVWYYEGSFVNGHFEGEGTMGWEGENQKEIGVWKNDEILPMEEEELKSLFSKLEDYEYHCISKAGKIGHVIEEGDGYKAVVVYTDVDNYDDDMIVVLYGEDINVDVDDYIEYTGIVMSSSQVRSFGYLNYGVGVRSTSWSESNYIDCVRPTLDTIDINQTQEQFGYVINIEKMEFADKESRLYLSIENNGSDRLNVYDFNVVVSQNSRQYEGVYNYAAEYPKIQSELLVGNRTEGIIAYEPLSNESFTITIDAYSEKWNESLEPFVFVVNGY